MRHLLADVRYALRQYARRPGTTLATLFVLTLGMTVAASLFTWVRAYTTSPPPGIAPAGDLVIVRGVISTPQARWSRRFSRAEFEAQAAAASSFARVAGWTTATVAIDRPGGEDTDWVLASFVTAGWFETLGVPLQAGAGLPAASAGDPLVAVISPGLRELHFASDAEALGRTLTVGGRPVTVVGVAPPRFQGVNVPEKRGLWLPDAAFDLLAAPTLERSYGTVARLAPGVSMATASAAMQAIAGNIAREEVAHDAREVRTSDVVPMVAMRADPLFEEEIGVMTTALTLLGLLVLVVTGTNASALQTGIAMTRGREIATRVSLGAPRRRVLRQLLVESGLLGLAAGAAAVALLLAVMRVLPAAMANLPFAMGFDATATAFTLGVALAAGVLAGMSPALFATRGDVVSGLKASGNANSTRRGTLQRGLVVAQILLTQPLVVMLVAMLLLLAGEVQRQSASAATGEVARVQLRAATREAAVATPAQESERLARQLRTLPEVAAAVPDPGHSIDYEGYTAQTAAPVAPFELDVQYVAPGWFEVVGRTLLAGRGFTDADVQPADSPQERALVIGEDLAAALWPGQSPIGKRLAPPPDFDFPPLRVVGVANTPPGAERRGGMSYVVYLAGPVERIALLVQLRGGAEAALRRLREALREAAPGLGIVELRTLGEIERQVRREFMMAMGIFAGLGLLALLLSAIGLYAVVAFAVSQKLGEIAVRLAIGARAGQVVARTMREGLKLVAIGLVLGLPASLAGLALVTRSTNMLPPVPVWQVGLLAMIGIAAIAALATWMPARRAAQVDPATHLRGD